MRGNTKRVDTTSWRQHFARIREVCPVMCYKSESIHDDVGLEGSRLRRLWLSRWALCGHRLHGTGRSTHVLYGVAQLIGAWLVLCAWMYISEHADEISRSLRELNQLMLKDSPTVDPTPCADGSLRDLKRWHALRTEGTEPTATSHV